jgi:hypothetical protein
MKLNFCPFMLFEHFLFHRNIFFLHYDVSFYWENAESRPRWKIQRTDCFLKVLTGHLLGGESRLIRYAVINCRLGKFFLQILMIQSHERNIKPFRAAYGFGMALSNQSELPAFFSPQQVNLKIPINFGLRQAGIVRSWKLTL